MDGDSPARAAPLQMQWPAPLTPREWDRRFPGILDGLGLMAGGANVILQLSRLPVGRGVLESRVESGNIFRHPFKRFRTTVTYLAVALLGNSAEKLAYRHAVNRQHAQVHSTAESPVAYKAFDPNLQLWVAACIYWGFADAHAKLHGPMTPEQAAEFYRLAEPIGTTLQVRPGMWPADLDAFTRYWEEGLQTLEMDEPVRRYLTDIADRKFLPPALGGGRGRFMTTGFLPPALRELMRFPWSPSHQQGFEHRLASMARFNRRLPRVIRQLPYTLAMWDLRRRMRRGLPLV
ncbi:MAG TPA: oxygenase MpaB family protein [Solimonas sp.]